MKRGTSNGLEHCGKFQEWAELDYRIEPSTWAWLCSLCGSVLRTEPFTPPDDVPIDVTQPVLFGRGSWNINGETVEIETPGWYARRGDYWWPVDVEVESR